MLAIPPTHPSDDGITPKGVTLYYSPPAIPLSRPLALPLSLLYPYEMKGFIYQAHLWLGLVVSVPVLAWAFSGFLYALPDTVEGSKYEAIEQSEVKIGANEAITKAREFAKSDLPVSALTLQKRNGVVEYQAISGVRAIIVNAETGEVMKSPPPTWATAFFREAHFYFFAYPYNALLTGVFSALACLSVLSGMYLNFVYWSSRLSGK